MSNLSDEQLVERYRGGDEGALSELIDRYADSVYRFVFRFLGDRQSAEDCAQETFIKVWKNLRRFDNRQKFKPWLYRIARHAAIDMWRSRKKSSLIIESTVDIEGDTVEFVDHRPSILDRLQASDQIGSVNAAIDRLPEIYRTVIDLHLRAELTLSEVAESLGENEDTVKSRYRRGIMKLKQLLS